MTEIEGAVADYNSAIRSVARSTDAALMDAALLFEQFAAGNIVIGGAPYTAAFVDGGLFSLDGVYPSSFGYALIAQEWVNTLNAAFDAGVPPIDLGALVNPTIFLGF
jgi:hypothetical protein